MLTILSVIILPLRGCLILLVTRMITNRIGLHEVLLPLLIPTSVDHIKTSGTERLVRSRHDFKLSTKRPYNEAYNVNFHRKATSKCPTDPLRRHMTYPSLRVDDFAHRPQIQIIFRGARSATFPSLFSKGQLTHPPPDEIFRDTYPPL